MNWDDYRAIEEFKYLSFMSAYKYNSYQGYLSGVRFIESLVTWLKQFSPEDRETAYLFVKEKLIYFSNAEIYRLIEKFFYEQVQPEIVATVALKLNLPEYKVWSTRESIREYEIEKRKILYMGLSDGARVDILRRLNNKNITSEQVALTTEIKDSKWDDLFAKLKNDLQHEEAPCFSNIYLIDDLIASGTTLLRPDKPKAEPAGKLVKFAKSFSESMKHLNADGRKIKVHLHHYIGIQMADERIQKSIKHHNAFFIQNMIPEIKSTYGLLIKDKYRVINSTDTHFGALCAQYYDNKIEGAHGAESGVVSKVFGYSGCGLPIIMEHNTPNNSLPLLWAETSGEGGAHKMKALFRRIERHSDLKRGYHE
jgi:hypothetical protein